MQTICICVVMVRSTLTGMGMTNTEFNRLPVFHIDTMVTGNCITTGAILGGNVRVGMEDSLYLSKGVLTESNAAQVAKIRRILEELSLDIATPDEARAMLDLKGGDQVAF